MGESEVTPREGKTILQPAILASSLSNVLNYRGTSIFLGDKQRRTVIFLGDKQRQVKHVKHKVRLNKDRERISMGYFVFPEEDSVIRSSKYKRPVYSQ
jgi:hypothetical protein